jgi:hypothetical protein
MPWVRIVRISDTHGQQANLRVPDGDRVSDSYCCRVLGEIV